MVSVLGELSDRDLVARLGARINDTIPTLHPYGFYILQDPELGCRFHVWLRSRRNRQNPDWPPHSHDRDMKSRVVVGEVENFEWDFIEKKSGRKAIYNVDYEGDFSIIRKTERVGDLSSGSRVSVSSGSCYFVSAGDIHATEVCKNSFVLTVAAFSKIITSTSYVVGDVKGDGFYKIRRSNISSNERIKIANEIASELSSIRL